MIPAKCRVHRLLRDSICGIPVVCDEALDASRRAFARGDESLSPDATGNRLASNVCSANPIRCNPSSRNVRGISMTEPSLHALDHALCNHVAAMTAAAIASSPRFETAVGSLIARRVFAGEAPELLATAADLETLATKSVYWVTTKWQADTPLYARWLDCVTDVKPLGEVFVSDWHDESLACIEVLQQPAQSYFYGLRAVKQWVEVIRALLRALQRDDLTPRPEGGHPTWQDPTQAGRSARTRIIRNRESDPSSEMLTVKQVASRLQISERSVYRMRDSGALPPPVKIRGCLRWRAADIDAWIASRCTSNSPRRRPC